MLVATMSINARLGCLKKTEFTLRRLSSRDSAEAKAKREASGESASVAVEANQAGRQYQNIFAPTNLGQQVGADTETETGAEATVEANQAGRQYQSIFDPGNLGKQVDSAPEND